MSRLLLNAIARTGRYFAIFPFALSLILTWFWLGLLDHSLIWFFLLGIFVGPTLLVGTCLLLGMVFAGTKPNSSKGVQREEAPGYWSEVEQVFEGSRRTSFRLYVNDDLEASVFESRSRFGLLGSTVHLDFGIPLLAYLDVEAFRAILKHEHAHVNNKDTNGGRNTAEFYKCFEFVFDFTPPGETVTGTVVALLLEDFSTLVKTEEMRLSREAELKADRYSEEQGEAKEIARALKILGSLAAYAREVIYEPMEVELLNSASAPLPAFKRLLKPEASEVFWQDLEVYWAKALKEKFDDTSSHPSYEARLQALDISPDMQVKTVRSNVLSELFSQDCLRTIDAEFESDWQDSIEHLYQ